MFKSRILAFAFVAALLTVFSAPAANAAGYGSQAFTVTVSPQTVYVEKAFTVTFTSTSDCQWSLDDFHGQTAPEAFGKVYVVHLTAPDKIGDYDITAECVWDPEKAISGPVTRSHKVIPALYVANASSDKLLADPQQDPVTGVVHVIDRSNALPDTGGSHEGVLIAGAGLVLVGAAVTVAARRRKTAA